MYCAVYHDNKKLCLLALDQSYTPDKTIMPVLIPFNEMFTSNLCEWYEKHVHDEHKIQIITYDFLYVYQGIANHIEVPYHYIFNNLFVDVYSVCHLINRRTKIMSEYNRIRPPKSLTMLFNYFQMNKVLYDTKKDLAKNTLKISQCYIKTITMNMV